METNTTVVKVRNTLDKTLVDIREAVKNVLAEFVR